MKKRKGIRLTVLAVLLLLSITSSVGCGSSKKVALDTSPSEGAGRIASTDPATSETAEPDPLPANGKTICIDPGHGFKDGGSGGTEVDFLPADYTEKDVNLDVAKRLEYHLKNLGYNVIMSHDGEKIPVAENGDNIFNVEERTAYVNTIPNIDYFISLHCNVFTTDSSVRGTRVYYADNGDERSAIAAEISNSITIQLSNDFPDFAPQTLSDIFYVIKYTYMPSTLIEMGFITNEDDAKALQDEEWRNNFAKSVAEGINNYFTQSTDE